MSSYADHPFRSMIETLRREAREHEVAAVMGDRERVGLSAERVSQAWRDLCTFDASVDINTILRHDDSAHDMAIEMACKAIHRAIEDVESIEAAQHLLTGAAFALEAAGAL